MEEREIKFRMWTGRRMIFRNWNDRNWYNAPSPNGKHVCQAMPEDSQYKIMQFTGRHDKNGKEIYEGDIVRHNRGYENKPRVMNGEVVYGAAMFGLMIPSGFASFVHQTFMEVIGNIHENSDLLEDVE